nr:hypothetical protein [Tanacetum cinerariifolium]
HVNLPQDLAPFVTLGIPIFPKKKTEEGMVDSQPMEEEFQGAGNKNLEDHLDIFSVASEQKEWPMPVWCKMFRQTLGGVARNWFDDLDPKSMDSFEELIQKFLEEFSQQKRTSKDNEDPSWNISFKTKRTQKTTSALEAL